MTDELFFDESTEQSRIKATIVRDYFWAWARVILPTVKQQNWPIAYIDLFAGPGRYKDGTKSTPLRVLESAIADAEMQQRLITRFNDADPENVRSLRSEIEALLDGRTYDECPHRTSTPVPDRARCVAVAESFLEAFRVVFQQRPLVRLIHADT